MVDRGLSGGTMRPTREPDPSSPFDMGAFKSTRNFRRFRMLLRQLERNKGPGRLSDTIFLIHAAIHGTLLRGQLQNYYFENNAEHPLLTLERPFSVLST